MHKLELLNLAIALEKICVQPKTFKIDSDSQLVVNYTMHQQGVQEVINVVKALANGQLRLEDVLTNNSDI